MLAFNENCDDNDELLVKLKTDVLFALKTLQKPYMGNVFEVFIRGTRHRVEVRYERDEWLSKNKDLIHMKYGGVRGTSADIEKFVLALAL